MNFTIKCSHCNTELTVRSTGWEREVELRVDACRCVQDYNSCHGCLEYHNGYEDGMNRASRLGSEKS